MIPRSLLMLPLLAASLAAAVRSAEPRTYPEAGGRLVFDRVRFLPVKGHEQDMVGGTFEGSNTSPWEGYEVLGRIEQPPKPGEYTELSFDGRRPHRWIRYVGPQGSYGRINKLEFYAGPRRLGGQGFGSVGVKNRGHHWPRVYAPDKNFFEGDQPDGQFVGMDIGDVATAIRPKLDPPEGDVPGPTTITLKTPTPGATIRYTLDGTTPSQTNGADYTQPLSVSQTTTIAAVSLKTSFADSPPSLATYIVGPPLPPHLTGFHIGNSITASTLRFPIFARTAGRQYTYHKFIKPGIQTQAIWNEHVNKSEWNDTFAKLGKVDIFTMQPRDMDVDREVKHERLFVELLARQSPGVQPWLYAEWSDIALSRPTDRGEVPLPSSQMTRLNPALTWEESCAAMLLYVEEVQHRLLATSPAGKPPKLLPSVLAVGWIKNLVDRRQIPGLGPDDFNKLIFFDNVHPGREGSYLVDLTWYAAFYGESPEGRVLPFDTTLTADQSAAFCRLAWDVVRNYPDCGYYETGTEPVAPPQFTSSAGPTPETRSVTLASTTPGAWFRYTLDGTEPSRTRGYVYCGTISVPQGAKPKAIAYRSGMADSVVREAE